MFIRLIGFVLLFTDVAFTVLFAIIFDVLLGYCNVFFVLVRLLLLSHGFL